MACGGSRTSGVTLAWRHAVRDTLPIGAGFLFLGGSYGLLMHAKGFALVYPVVMAALIYAGSMEFVTATLLLGTFDPLTALFMALMVNSRHLFYALAMLDAFRGMGWKKPYLIFGMCDETFAVNSAAPHRPGMDRGWFMFLVTVLNQVYWVGGATLGWLVGGGLPASGTRGVDFVLTALFAVIFVEQWLQSSRHLPALIGVASSLVGLAVFGPERFMVPSLALMLVAFVLLRRRMDDGMDDGMDGAPAPVGAGSGGGRS